MYRQYEDPKALEERCKELEAQLEQETDEEQKIDLVIEICELKDRINFAWQDDEYDSDYAS